jgi:hypothetical protein
MPDHAYLQLGLGSHDFVCFQADGLQSKQRDMHLMEDGTIALDWVNNYETYFEMNE